ncbi:hypothetical protein Hanom_Chr00s000745g01657791 [Helianthus anomalus]
MNIFKKKTSPKEFTDALRESKREMAVATRDMKVYELSGTTLSVALFTDVANSKYYFCTLFFRLNLCVIEV